MTGAPGKLAALALAALVVWMAADGVARPVLGAFARLDEDARLARAAIARLETRVRAGADLALRAAEIERLAAASELQLVADTPALAAAQVQRRLGDLAELEGLGVLSVQTMPTAEIEGLRRVAVRAELTGSIAGLASLLHEIESGRPMLFVERLEIRARPPDAGGLRLGPPRGDGDRDALMVRLDVSGYLAGGGAS